MSHKKTSGHFVVTYPKEQLLLKHASNFFWAKNQVSLDNASGFQFGRADSTYFVYFVFITFTYLLVYCVCICTHACVCVCVCACATEHMWKSEDNFQELVLPPPTESSHCSISCISCSLKESRKRTICLVPSCIPPVCKHTLSIVFLPWWIAR